MMSREPDEDLVREAADERRARATERRHATAWDEPPEYYDDEPSFCRKPDGRGVVNPRCQHTIDQPKGEEAPRQCRAAAQRGSTVCRQHATLNPTGDA